MLFRSHWNKDDSNYTGISTEKKIVVQKFDGYEVHYMPYNGNLRDKLTAIHGSYFRLFTRFLSLLEIILQHFVLFIIPSRQLYYYSKDLLKKNPEIDFLIVSGRPFILFRFGYLLKKMKPKLKWIADYRDPWNTDCWLNKSTPGFLKKLEIKSEKKWLSNAETFITVSEKWKEDLEVFLNKKGHVVFNGYEDDDKLFFENNKLKTDVFTIFHNGTIYGSHNLDVFIESIKTLIDTGNDKIKVLFPGINIHKTESERLKIAIKGYESYFEISERIPHTLLIQKMATAQLFILFGITELRGWIPLKLFEYFAAGKPILYCPAIDTIISEMIQETNTGFTTQNIPETTMLLEKLYNNWCQDSEIPFKPNTQAIEKYSRQNQAQKLSQILMAMMDEKNDRNRSF